MSFGLALRYTLVGLVCLGFSWYVVFQARFLLAGPQIILENEPATAQTERHITLSGQTKNIANLTLNGRPIVTDENGRFEEAVILENGYTVTTLRAADLYGRETIITRPFVYQNIPN